MKVQYRSSRFTYNKIIKINWYDDDESEIMIEKKHRTSPEESDS